MYPPFLKSFLKVTFGYNKSMWYARQSHRFHHCHHFHCTANENEDLSGLVMQNFLEDLTQDLSYTNSHTDGLFMFLYCFVGYLFGGMISHKLPSLPFL